MFRPEKQREKRNTQESPDSLHPPTFSVGHASFAYPSRIADSLGCFELFAQSRTARSPTIGGGYYEASVPNQVKTTWQVTSPIQWDCTTDKIRWPAIRAVLSPMCLIRKALGGPCTRYNLSAHIRIAPFPLRSGRDRGIQLTVSNFKTELPLVAIASCRLHPWGTL